jgi:hypothetical protein
LQLTPDAEDTEACPDSRSAWRLEGFLILPSALKDKETDASGGNVVGQFERQYTVLKTDKRASYQLVAGGEAGSECGLLTIDSTGFRLQAPDHASSLGTLQTLPTEN